MNTQRRRKIKYIITIAGVVLLGIGTWGTITLITSTPPYSGVQEVQRQTGRTIILPATLPRDTTITNHPAYDRVTDSIVTRVAIGDASVTFTQQKRPQADLKQIDTEDTFLINAGSVYILKGETGRLQAIVETSDSWVIVNASTKLSIAAFKELLESLSAV